MNSPFQNTVSFPKSHHLKRLVSAVALSAGSLFGAVQTYDNPDLTTPPGDNPDNPGIVPAIGVWVDFNAVADVDKVFLVDNLAGIPGRTDPASGRFELIWNTNFDPPASQVLNFGSEIFGNAVLGTSVPFTLGDVTTAVLSPERVGEGVVIGPSLFAAPPGFTDSGGNPQTELVADFLELAGTFGVWNPDLGRGFIAIRFSSTPIPFNPAFHKYGYIDVTINPDYSITVHGIAWNDTPTQPVTTAFIGLDLTAPSDFTATALSANAITLQWTDNSTEGGFRIERRLSGGGAFTVIDTVGANVTQFLDLTALPSTSYEYRVIATLGANESTPSSVDSATTPADTGPPPAPSQVTASFTSNSVTVRWSDNATTEAYYVVERSFNGGNFELAGTVPFDSEEFTDTQLAGGFQYVYRVRAENPQPSANASISFFLPDAASTIAADLVRDGAAYGTPTGSGWVLGVWDVAPPLSTHQELSGRITITQGTGTNGHATHTSGTMIATGIRDGAKGVAPDAAIDFYTIQAAPLEVAGAGMTLPGENGKLSISNHSYRLVDAGWEESIDIGVDWVFRVSATGPLEHSRFGRYTPIVRDVDAGLFNVPYHLAVRSGNNDRDDGPVNGDTVYLSIADDDTNTSVIYDDSIHPLPEGQVDGGYDTLNSGSLAKNALTVGSTGVAVRDRTTGALISASGVSASSSWGPADDGRIKPDVVALGESVFNADDGGDTIYSTRTGVSMSAASVSGAAVLLSDFYFSLFNSYLRSSTLKGLFIQTADDLTPSGPDYKTGWGLVNTKAAADLIQFHADNPELRSILEGRLTESKPTTTFTLTVPGGVPFKATLTWLDPAGPVKTALDDPTPDLVRDLDIRITGNATTYFPYVMPFAQNPGSASPAALAATGDNTTDNVEQIFVSSLPAGTYTVTVSQKTAPGPDGSVFSLIMDGHDGLALPGEAFTGNAVQPVVSAEESAGVVVVYGVGFRLGDSTVTIKRSSDGVVVGTGELVEVFADSIRFRLPSLPDDSYDIVVNGTELRNAILPSSFTGDTYGQWVLDNLPQSTWFRPDLSGESGNFENDLFPNLLDYAYGFSPLLVDAVTPVSLVTQGSGAGFRLGLDFPIRTAAGDLAYGLEVNDSLSPSGWSDLGIVPSPSGPPAGIVRPHEVFDTSSVGDGRFIRLSVETVPVQAP